MVAIVIRLTGSDTQLKWVVHSIATKTRLPDADIGKFYYVLIFYSNTLLMLPYTVITFYYLLLELK